MSGPGCCFILWFPEGEIKQPVWGWFQVGLCHLHFRLHADRRVELPEGRPGKGRCPGFPDCFTIHIHASSSLSSDLHTPVELGLWWSSERFLKEGKSKGILRVAPAIPQVSQIIEAGEPCQIWMGWKNPVGCSSKRNPTTTTPIIKVKSYKLKIQKI